MRRPGGGGESLWVSCLGFMSSRERRTRTAPTPTIIMLAAMATNTREGTW